MALLQIAEPDARPEPREARRAVGIDLGTTNSLVATIRDGAAVVLEDSLGRALLPSVVRYMRDGSVQVGSAAWSQQARDPKNAIASVKRLMGRGLDDVVHAQNMPYDFVDQPGMVQLRTVAGVKSPVEVSAQILKALRARAEVALGGELFGAVVTVPAYFDDAQRQATKDAARLAGLNVLRLLNEPTAAAIAYGLDNAASGIFAVFDLGGGTFDISILKLSKGVFEVLATGGDSALGGDDFDQRLACAVIEREDIAPLSPQDTRLLLLESREAKEGLSAAGSVRVAATLASGERLDTVVTAAEFQELTKQLVQKTIAPTRRALRDAGLSTSDITGVVLVGGATRMPHVRKAVAEFFGQTPLTNLDPDKVVALGAAMQADVLAGNRGKDHEWLLLDVIPLSLGLETMGGLAEKLIPRNSTIPIAKAQEFTTFKAGQTAIAIHVVQGERELVSACRSLARFELRGIPPMAAGAARIRVNFEVDADGLLRVYAREQSTGVEAAIEVKPSYGLSDAEITNMLRDSYDHATDDMAARALGEARVDLQQTVTATEAALEADADLLSNGQREAIDSALGEARAALESADHRAVKAATDALNRATGEFAQTRMNRGMRRALAGRRIDEIKV